MRLSETPTVRASWIPVVAISLLLLGAAVGRAGQAIRYSTDWTDAKGGKHAAVFEGTARNGVIAGTVTLDGADLAVSASIAGETVSGDILGPTGSAIGHFSGGRDSSGTIRGQAQFGSATYPWDLPPSALPGRLLIPE